MKVHAVNEELTRLQSKSIVQNKDTLSRVSDAIEKFRVQRQ